MIVPRVFLVVKEYQEIWRAEDFKFSPPLLILNWTWGFQLLPPIGPLPIFNWLFYKKKYLRTGIQTQVDLATQPDTIAATFGSDGN